MIRFRNKLTARRCTMFNAAYQHMTSCIDEIYKELTKSKAPTAQGGVAFLSLEDAEVCHPSPFLI